MTNRRPVLIAVAVAALAGGGLLAQMLVLGPLTEKAAGAEIARQEAAAQQAKLAGLRAEAARLAAARTRSLPASEAVAKKEYKDLLERLLHQAKVPDPVKITYKSDNTRVLAGTAANAANAAKKPPYTRVVYDVAFEKADLWQVVDFLQAYYRTNLTQQITAVSIKRADETSGPGGKKGGDRKDLNVTLTTEALILDGAEDRRTALPVPKAFAAIGGGAGFQAVTRSPEYGLRLTTPTIASVLAARPRDYTVVVARDPFHGPLPPPEKPRPPAPPPPVVVAAPAPPPPPKEDIAPFIRLTDATGRDDGSGVAGLFDAANNLSYVIEYGPAGTRVEKFTPGTGRRQPGGKARSADLLVISDEFSGTYRSYKVVGIDGGSLSVVEAAGKGGPSKEKPATGLPAVFGGAAAALPQPAAGRVIQWRVGQTLKDADPAAPGMGGRAVPVAAPATLPPAVDPEEPGV